MKSDECEETILSIMAEMDGDPPPLSAEQTARHLIGCERCQMEIKRQEEVANLLQGQKRRAAAVSLWFEIEKRMGDKPIARRGFFLLLAAVLVIYKLVEMLPARDSGFLLKLVPVVLIAALFILYKENPFKINTDLKLEGEL